MTRRSFFMLPVVTAVAAVPDTPRNRLVIGANEFNGQFAAWATAMNDRPETLNVHAIEAWEHLPALWRKVESLWSAWLKG